MGWIVFDQPARKNAINAPDSVVVSGDAAAVEALLADFAQRNVQGQRLFVSLAGHSPLGSINTLLGVQARRPSFYDMTGELSRLQVPLLVMTGDEDEPSIEASIMVKRCAPAASLAVLPQSGHGINLEEPALFNQLLEDFFHQVEAGRWTRRDPRSPVVSIYGPGGKP